MANVNGDGGRPPVSWRCSGREVLRLVESGSRAADAAAAAGVTVATMTRHLHAAGWFVTRWPVDCDGVLAAFGVSLRYRRIVHVERLIALRAAMLRREGSRGDAGVSVPWVSVLPLVGVSSVAVSSVQDAASRWERDEQLRAGATGSMAALSVVPLPGDPGSLVGVDPNRPDSPYQRSMSPSESATRRARSRMNVHVGVVIRMYTMEGKSLRQIADVAGVSPATVARRLRDMGVSVREPGASGKGRK